MIELKIAVKDNKLIKVRDTLLIEDTINNIRCCFEFRSGWDNEVPKVVFVKGHIYPATKNPQSITVELENNACVVPPEIIASNGEFSVGLFGESNSGTVVTNWLYYKTRWGCYDIGISPNPPAPSEYDQVIKALGNKSDINHIHEEYVTDDEMAEALSGKQDVISDDIYDRYGAADAALKDAKEYTDEKTAEVQTAAKKYADDEDALIEESVDALADDLAALADNVTIAGDKIAEIMAVADTHALKADVEAVDAKFGNYVKSSGYAADKANTDKAIANRYTKDEADAKFAIKGADAYDDTKLAGRVDAIEADYLKKADKTEVSNAIAAEKERAEGVEQSLQNQINLITNNNDMDEVVKSIEEFTNYITEHGEIADGFRADINKNKADIAANAKELENHKASIGALNTVIASKAANADLEAAVARIEANEDVVASSVVYTEQALTEEQNAQARKNIGASAMPLEFTVTHNTDGSWTSSKTYSELIDSLTFAPDRVVLCDDGAHKLPLVANQDGYLHFSGYRGGVLHDVTITADGMDVYIEAIEDFINCSVDTKLGDISDDLAELLPPEATTEDNGKVLQVVDGKPSWEEPAGGGASIIDVFGLPTENIDAGSFYRLTTANCAGGGEILQSNTTIHYVDALPRTGEPVMDIDTEQLQWYYNMTNGVVYGYVDDVLSQAAASMGLPLPEGWCPFSLLYENTGYFCNLAIITVETLPGDGLPAVHLVDDEIQGMCVYYNVSDNIVYSYITQALAEYITNNFGHPIVEGWHPSESLMALTGLAYGGVITSLDEIEGGDDALYILVSSKLYAYNNQWEPLKEEHEFIQPDWNQTDDTQPDYILNKPIDGNGKIYSVLLYQPDWNQTNKYAGDYIKNKPADVLENGKVKSEYLHQSDWDVCDETKPDYVKNKPVYTVSAGTVWYDHTASSNEFYDDGTISAQYFTGIAFNPELEYNIEWGSLQFVNKKINTNSNLIELGNNCHIEYYGVNNGHIIDNARRITEPQRLKITVAQDYIKTLDEKYLPDSVTTTLANTANTAKSSAEAAQLSALQANNKVDELKADLDTALDAILAIQKELIGVTLIAFTIDGTEYQAEDGMTWREWCESEYCDGRFKSMVLDDGDYIASSMAETLGFAVSDMAYGMPVFGLADRTIVANSVWYLVD